MKWKSVEQFNFTPEFLARQLSLRLPEGEPHINVKEMLNALAFDTAAAELLNVVMYMRHRDISRLD